MNQNDNDSEDEDFDFLDDNEIERNQNKYVELMWRGITDKTIDQDWTFFKVNTRKDYVKIFQNYKMEEFMDTIRK